MNLVYVLGCRYDLLYQLDDYGECRIGLREEKLRFSLVQFAKIKGFLQFSPPPQALPENTKSHRVSPALLRNLGT